MGPRRVGGISSGQGQSNLGNKHRKRPKLVKIDMPCGDVGTRARKKKVPQRVRQMRARLRKEGAFAKIGEKEKKDSP